MIEFKILHNSKRSNARLGILKTPHGEIETPAFVPVGTSAVVKTLTAEEVLRTKSQLLIANTFHLHLKPGERLVKHHGGIHEFMQWPKPIMTDSGGFQVFSLGFGTDLGVGKILKYFHGISEDAVKFGAQPQNVKIREHGVEFRSPIDGTKLFLGPEGSIRIQEDIGADIMFAFDECTPPLANHEYARDALQRTHRWAKESLAARRSKQALYGIVQGSHFKDLRAEAAAYVSALPFDGFGIGGDLGKTKKDMMNILGWTMPHLAASRPRHLLGIGHLEDMPLIVKKGIDTFDCIVPTHYARHGVAFTSEGKLDMRSVRFLKIKKPLDPRCRCEVCGTYTKGYVAHLIRAKEITGLRLLTFHNLFYFNTIVENIRKQIKQNKL